MAIYTSAFRIFSTVVSDPKYGPVLAGACSPIPLSTELKFDVRLELALKLSEGREFDADGDGAGDGYWIYPLEKVLSRDPYVKGIALGWEDGSPHTGFVLHVRRDDLEDMTEESAWVVTFDVIATFDRWEHDGNATYFRFLLPPEMTKDSRLLSGPERPSMFWNDFRKCYEE